MNRIQMISDKIEVYGGSIRQSMCCSRTIVNLLILVLIVGIGTGCAGISQKNNGSGHNQAGSTPWMVRGRAVGAVPDESSDIDPIGGAVDVSNDVTPEVDLSYFLNDHIALETILGTTNHDVDANETSAGDLDVGEVSLIPATVTAQYHFQPDHWWKPYIGTGVSYGIFYDEDAPSSGGGAGITDVDYQDSTGWALQSGVDIDLGRPGWALNLDVKKLFLQTDVEISSAAGPVEADVDLDPWIFGIGVTYDF